MTIDLLPVRHLKRVGYGIVETVQSEWFVIVHLSRFPSWLDISVDDPQEGN